MSRNILLHTGMLTLAVGLIVCLAIVRSNRTPTNRPAPIVASPKPVQSTVHSPAAAPANDDEVAAPRPKAEANPEKLPVALHDSTLKGLIQNAKVAELRGDAKTRNAMVKGLKRQSDRSRELIQKEIASTQDARAASALLKLMEALQ